MTESITILGATGSIGQSTLDVILAHRQRFSVSAVVGGRDGEALARTARRLGAAFAAVSDEAGFAALKAGLSGSGIACAAGSAAVDEAVQRDADIVVAAISGTAGLGPTHAALKPGRRIALANKESLVCAGEALMRDAARIGAIILPMDSEHNALKQALGDGDLAHVEMMIVTASGGPFRTWSAEEIAVATPAQAAAHPVWSMGSKINIDSATLMNKGLELIEAHHLFGLRPDQLGVVVHPQSIIHGLVNWIDGAVTAGLAVPDMKVPIIDCLAGGTRLPLRTKRLDLAQIGSLTFERPDEARFPCLRLAREALAAGGGMTAVMNGANEIAVAAFMDGLIAFPEIPRIVEESCDKSPAAAGPAPGSVEEALAIDAEARRIARALLPAGAARSGRKVEGR